MILSSLGSNLRLKDRKLEISLEKPVLLLKEVSEPLKGKGAEHGPLEPTQVLNKKGTYSVLYTINPLGLHKLKAIRTCFMTGKDFKLKFALNSTIAM